MPTRVGTASQVNASAGNGSTSVTVPEGCNAVVAFACWWDGNANSTLSLTLGGNALTTRASRVDVSDLNAVYVGTIVNPTEGSQTLAWTWSNGGARSEGGEIILVYIQDANTADLFRDADVAAQTGSTAPSITIDSNSTDLVVAYGMRYNSVAGSVGVTGTAFINDAFLNQHIYDVTEVTAGASSTTVTITTTPTYSAVAAISLKEAAAPSGELFGTAGADFTGSGSLSGAGALNGTASAAFSSSSVLSGLGRMDGAGAVSFSASSALSGLGSLNGAASIAFSGSGVAGGQGSLAGAASLGFVNSGALFGAGVLSGLAGCAFVGPASISGAGALTGQSTVTISAAGSLASDSALAGSAALGFLGSGAIQANGRLAASSAVAFTASSGLSGSGALFGSATIALSATAVAASNDRLIGSAVISIAGQSSLGAIGRLVATSQIVISAEATTVPTMSGSLVCASINMLPMIGGAVSSDVALAGTASASTVVSLDVPSSFIPAIGGQVSMDRCD